MKNSLIQRNFFFSEVLKNYLKEESEPPPKPLDYLVTSEGILIDSNTISFKELIEGQPEELREGVQKKIGILA